jgi:hypothetical protein
VLQSTSDPITLRQFPRINPMVLKSLYASKGRRVCFEDHRLVALSLIFQRFSSSLLTSLTLGGTLG